jgi:hypothetical protein
MEVLLIVLAVIIVLQLIVAVQFKEIAEMKGHEGYFWWCFLFGPAGWAMVIALPDQKKPAEQPSTATPVVPAPDVAMPTDELPDL